MPFFARLLLLSLGFMIPLGVTCLVTMRIHPSDQVRRIYVRSLTALRYGAVITACILGLYFVVEALIA